MNPTTSSSNIIINDSRRRRTSVSSTASVRSTRSSWRVPSLKQPPRTQLSAVFAEGQTPSRSPSNPQSAMSLLEARYAASSSVSSTSPNLNRIRVDESPLEDTLTESPTTHNIDDNSPSRGRQSTQRNITLAGTSPQADLSPPLDQSANDIILKPANPSTVVTLQAPPTASDPQPTELQLATTLETVTPGNQKKRKQSSVSSGWFGTSGRSKAQKVVTVVEHPSAVSNAPIKEETVAPNEAVADVRLETPAPPQPVAKIEENILPTATTIQPSTSSWFSRSKPTTSAPAAVAPQVIAPESITLPPANQPTPTPVVSPPVIIAASSVPVPATPAAPSPSRASWFGSRRGRPESVSITPPPLDALDTVMSTPRPPSIAPTLDAEPDPPSAMSESITDESMTATITPMTFAEAQAQSRLPGPQSWFRLGVKRESATPSVDSTVPSLPPSPKREAAPMTRLVPISNPSVTSLGSSSARYALSYPLLGKPKVNLQDALKDARKDALHTNGATAVANVHIAPVPEISEEMVIDTSPSVASSSASIASGSSVQPPPSASWWPYFGKPAPILVAPQDITLPESGQIAPSEGVPSSAASSIAPSSSDGQQVIASAQQISGDNSSNPLQVDNATWFGIWSWGSQAIPPLESQKTEAELIKEEALARGQTSPPITSASTVMPELPTPRLAEIASAMSGRNPIEDDSVENRSSWTSFFSLRAAHGAKRLTMQVGEEEDVMDLEGDPEAPVVSPPNTEKNPAKMVAKNDKAAVVAPTPPPKPSGRSSSTEPSGSRTKRTAPPLTDSGSIRQKVIDANKSTPAKRSSSATPSKRSLPPSAPPKAPNMVLPTFGDTFYTLPRALPPYSRPRPTPLRRIMSGVFGLGGQGSMNTPSLDEMKEWQNRSSYTVPKDYEGLHAARDVGRDLPRVGGVLGIQDVGGIRDCKRVAILGIHGWFPGTIMRTLLGEPTGTSPKFASMMETAVQEFMDKQGVTLEKVTSMPLEGDGTIERRVEKLYEYFLSKKEWVEDLHEADVIFVATHSQGSVVSTQLLDKLIADGHVRTSKNWEVIKTVVETSNAIGGMGIAIPPPRPPQRICCLALCGIHLGPLLYLGTSSFVNPYIQYFESAAARELFEFQDTETEVSKRYIASLTNVLEHGVKFVYVASLDDQVVPIYSGLFTAINHPRILRALYIDGDAYSSSDFLSNLLVLLIRMRNAGIDDGGLLTHLSEATAGSLSGVGHSTAYLDSGAYHLAVRYLFETSDALGDDPQLDVEPFIAKASRNDYEIPWALRGLIADPRCQELFGKELAELRATFDDWHPRTSAMKEVRKKLEPIRGRRSRFAPDPFTYSHSPTSAPSASPTSPAFSKSNNR